MTTISDLIRRECACGNVWFAEMTEAASDECKECFLERTRKSKMTTVQVRDELDQTAPPEPEGVNGVHDTETPAPKRQRKAKAVTFSPAHHVTTGGLETQNQSAPVDDVVTRLEATVREINAEEARLEGQLDRIRKARQSLVGTGFGEVIIGTRPSVPVMLTPHGDGGKVTIHRTRSPKSTTRHRRTEAEIHDGVESVVALVRKHKDGIGAQKIREVLGLRAADMPRLLKDAIKGKLLKSTGKKRATVYTLGSKA
jgi:hypothetical protein